MVSFFSFFQEKNTVFIFLSKNPVLNVVEDEDDLIFDGRTYKQSHNINYQQIAK